MNATNTVAFSDLQILETADGFVAYLGGWDAPWTATTLEEILAEVAHDLDEAGVSYVNDLD